VQQILLEACSLLTTLKMGRANPFRIWGTTYQWTRHQIPTSSHM